MTNKVKDVDIKSLTSSIQDGVIRNFAYWDIFWPGDIRTYYALY